MRSDLALAALASAAVPGMKPVAVAHLAQDDETDHQQAVVEDATGRRWLVRSPLTPVAGARLRRGDELVRQLSRHLPFKVPAPVGYAAIGQDGHAVVYPYVEGMPLDLTRLPAGPGLASAVGRAIAAIHNIPRGAFEEQDVPVFDNAGCRQRLIAEVDRAAETGRVPTGLLGRWEEAFDAAPLWQFATTPVHGALTGAAMLVAFGDEDAASGRVVAVTDWEEAMVADPANDLAALHAAASPAAWESVLDAYSLARAQRPDPYLHARARLVAETSRLRGLARAVSEEDESLIRRIVEALRRMDRLTEDDDSLVPVTARGAGTAPTGAVGAVGATGTADPASTATEQASAATAAQTLPADPIVLASRRAAAPGDDDSSLDADADATAEVPVEAALAGLRGTDGREGSVPEDTGSDSTEPDSTGSDSTSPDSTGPDGTEPDSTGQQDTLGTEIEPDVVKHHDAETSDPAPEDPPSADEPAAGEPADDAPAADASDDEQERLHELYGMPAPQRDDT